MEAGGPTLDSESETSRVVVVVVVVVDDDDDASARARRTFRRDDFHDPRGDPLAGDALNVRERVAELLRGGVKRRARRHTRRRRSLLKFHRRSQRALHLGLIEHRVVRVATSRGRAREAF